MNVFIRNFEPIRQLTRKSSNFFFSSRRRHTRYIGDWSSDVCSSDLIPPGADPAAGEVISAHTTEGGRRGREASIPGGLGAPSGEGRDPPVGLLGDGRSRPSPCRGLRPGGGQGQGSPSRGTDPSP